MKIGFDAKRLFTNLTGLGNYSRTCIHAYHHAFPADDLVLFTPAIKEDPRIDPFAADPGYNIIRPKGYQPLWRTFDIVKDIAASDVDIYHGLSHELPVGISRLPVRKVVTIHDLIFEYYPDDNPWLDRKIYHWKWKHACQTADIIITISEQTRKDVIEYYDIPPEKIRLIYPPVEPLFSNTISTEEIIEIRRKHALPANYNLYVGSVISRKNLMSIIIAMAIAGPKDRLPLVIIGNGHAYKKRVIRHAEDAGISELLLWLNPDFADFPAIYKGAQMMIYPSLHEGFGLPVAEAMLAGIPVITSSQSSLKEVGGDAAVLVDPLDAEQIANAMVTVASDKQLREKMIANGYRHVRKFDPRTIVRQIHDVYLDLT